MFITKKLAVNFNINGRGNNGHNKPWFGFCYGSWFPKVTYNGGKLKDNEVADYGLRWLCFHSSVTFWP